LVKITKIKKQTETKTKKYVDLSSGSKKKLENTLERLERCGITIYESKKMSDTQLRQALGFKGKKTSFDGLKRNINQLSLDMSRKQGSINLVLAKKVKQGYRGKGLKIQRGILVKTCGDTFTSIALDLEKAGLSKKESYIATRRILKVPKYLYPKQLNRKEREILGNYGY